jgi:hypothetical protein
VRITYERIGKTDVLSVVEEAGPVKIIFGNQDQGSFGILPDGTIVRVPPDSPVDEDQAALRLLKTMSAAAPAVGGSAMLTLCERLAIEIAQIELGIGKKLQFGMPTDPNKQEELATLRALFESEGCAKSSTPL